MKKRAFVALLLMTLTMTLIPTSAQSATEPTFVAMMGMVELYGGKRAYGYIGAFAEVNKSAEVGLFWTLQPPVHIAVIPYNYSFHAARLVSTKTVELNYSGRDFYVSGLWDVYNITFCYRKDGFHRIVKLWVDDGFGELNVIKNWTTFTVNIVYPVKEIVGIVLRYCIRPIKPIPIGDVTCPKTDLYAPDVPDGKIDIHDLVHVAKAYGNPPGIRKCDDQIDINCDFSVDINCDYIVNIYDLTTVAANLGESY